MFFIYGTTRTKSDLGRVLCMQCGYCQRVCWHKLFKIRKWFSFFFIPIIPYGKEHVFICELCDTAFDIKDEYLEKVMLINEKAVEMEDGLITEEEYQAYVDKEL